MGKYENGVYTRKLILSVSRQLFLEKGFHETSIEDICRAAHVNRNTINYHFRDKENLRYEVNWELLMEYRRIITPYCASDELQIILAIYLAWCHAVKNPGVRKFCVDYGRDYPVYIPTKPLPTYYRMLYQHVFAEVWPVENIPSLNFSAIYGHLISEMQLLGDQPEQYNGKELFLHGMKACLELWNIPEEKVKAFWKKMTEAIDQLPDAVFEKLPG